jgi:hypothetical protein
MPAAETEHQRWTFRRPAYIFDAPAGRDQRLFLQARLLPVVFEKTGPVRLTLWINGQRIGEQPMPRPADYNLEWTVLDRLLRADGVTLVETELDKYFIAQDDGNHLGYMFLGGGFSR